MTQYKTYYAAKDPQTGLFFNAKLLKYVPLDSPMVISLATSHKRMKAMLKYASNKCFFKEEADEVTSLKIVPMKLIEDRPHAHV